MADHTGGEPIYILPVVAFTCPRCGRSEPTTAGNKKRCRACAADVTKAVVAAKRARKRRPQWLQAKLSGPT